ncbi:MAG: UvrD-helicase domain-containing protein [Flavobacteriales bacterium]|nr:UvrD-helicase domain-containing protein [Bacteroidota bacterium]MCB9240108.1 UvrD-helicase domain-containing protein [Flavobacteriales bacterium]
MNPGETAPFLDGLNEPQKQAVLQTEGPVMIVAGAGSGKTRVLTYRIAYMIHKGVDPFNILALTFTNKAAREMRIRIEKAVGTEARNIWMGTFHSVFAKILRIEADKLGYPSNFTIYDTDDSKSLIKTIVKEMKLDEKVYKPAYVLNRISAAKNSLITYKMYESNDDLTAHDAVSSRPFIHKIYSTYAKRCFMAGAMDFDDLLIKTYELFTKFPDALNKYQHKFRYIMVDEYQDTNHCQYMIIKKLAAVNENICVVGDDAQSIYSFRGATIRNILNFEKDYPDLKVFKLEQNYRSTQTIVDAAGGIIAKNKDQIEKKVWTQNDLGEKIRIIRAVTDNEEATLIAQSIFEEKMKNQLHNKDFAILYRTNAQSRSLEESLRKHNIPYRIYGGLSFYHRKEIKDLIAYLRLTVNHKDEEALKRIINYPARGIGKTSLERVQLLAADQGISWWEILTAAELFDDLRSASGKLKDFVVMIKSFATMLQKSDAYELAMHIAKSTGILKTLHEDKTVEGMNRYENVVELLNGIKEFVEDDTSELEKTLPTYLQDIALLTDADKDDDNNDKVSLMTIHSAKGLEFAHVYMPGMEENLFPSQMSLGNRQDLEEERRLFYVGMTRAEKKLTLAFAHSRFRFGQLLPCEPSRFISELNEEFVAMDPKSSNQTSLRGRRIDSGTPERIKSGGSTSRFGRSNSPTKPAPLPPVIKDFTPEDTSSIKQSDVVEHQRFGKGIVQLVDGEGLNRKATIDFESFGTKQLVLRFAKLRFIQ